MSTAAAAEKYAALGKLVVVARELEHVGYDLARALGVLDPEKRNITPAIKEARKQVRQGLPPWTRNVGSDDVQHWIDVAIPIFERRNREVHWRQYRRFEQGEWVPVRSALREAIEEPASSLQDLVHLTEEAQAARKVGSTILGQLLFEVRRGVLHLHPLLARPDRMWVPLVLYQDDGWPERPTDEELDAWYENLVRSAPPEWGTWPTERHAQQAPSTKAQR